MSAEVLARFDAVIDVRSPAEFAEDHVPGAISAPVLDNEERARVGTIYKQVSPFDAKKLGAALVAKNIARHIEEKFAAMPRDWKPLVYCWRGGKRSGAMAHILREIGWDAWSVEGGYKAYRHFIVDALSTLPLQFGFRVIHGTTGSGKSRLLRALGDAGAQVLDLEDLAAHRGSVLGNLPDRPQPSQKMFETLLWDALRKFDPAKPVFVEGESKKIGQLQVPEALMHAMRASDCVLLEAGRETRIALLSDEYRHFFADPAVLYAQLDCLRGLYGAQVIEDWKGLAARGEWHDLVGSLLDDHYDPAYRRSALRNYVKLPEAAQVTLDSPADEDFARLARRLIEIPQLEAA
ncbi:MAG: tRNA 2-selenouridine(34) synthase MnmH [Proteobacteria bacterium]|nr:tRNA 2-selenouridine(34) synthase MnmH [Pseudomonadota bacterium]